MKKILFILLISTQIFAASSFFTLDKVENLSLYISSKNSFISKAQKNEIKEKVKTKLQKAGFVFGETDAIIFVIKIRAIEVEKMTVVDVEISLDEDVITHRKEGVEAFALTYVDQKMIKSTQPYEDTMKTLDVLIDKFILLHQDDNEE